MAFRLPTLSITILVIALTLLLLLYQVQCSPRRKGSSGSGGYSGGGWAQSSGSNSHFGGGWSNPNRGNTGGQYSAGGWNIPSNTNSGNAGNRYSGGGWNAHSNPSYGNKANHNSAGGWNIPSGGNTGNKYYGAGTGDLGKVKNVKKGGAKNFIKKNWKKAAAFGAGAYIGYELSKAIGNLFNPSVFNYNGVQYDFNTWDRYARVDGWVCRNDGDCNWLDRHLQCQSKGFSMADIHGDWPWKQDLKGRCICDDGYLFDKHSGTCYQSSGAPSWLIAIISIIIFFGLVGCCCFCFCKLIRN